MLGMLSLPFLAVLALYEKNVPVSIAVFRLKLVFGAMFVLGALVYWKLSLLARELVRLVSLTRDSIENLKAVQRQVTHSEKMVALGRLTAGAAHEISNPLTAILGYSELLTDIPSLSPNDLANARLIQQQVRQAQAAVNSLRNTARQNHSANSVIVDKNPAS
jgi:signal transduction histidine kinase